MCGIGLYASFSSQLKEKDLSLFMKSILHRGPDSQNIIQLNEKLLIASNRLAIIDVNQRSNQPMEYQHLTITFNGAIYNYLELKEELLKLGHSFKTESDTEVILHAYKEFGLDCVHKFNGMWAFVIHDAKSKTLFAARDRFSIKPLYYYHSSSSFLIGSEIKQFKTMENLNLSYNKRKIVDYISSGGFKNFDHKTFYNEIFQLEGGTYLVFNLEDFSKNIYKYYDFKDDKGEMKEIKDLKSLVKDSIQMRKRSDMKFGITLSGGIDSSILAIESIENSSLNSYSFIETRDNELNEESYIYSILEDYPHTNHQVTFPEEFRELVKECIYYQDEPLASLSTVAQFLVYKLAKSKGEKVLFSGQGADEVFGGYPRFFMFIPKLSFLFHYKNVFSLFKILKKSMPADTESIFKVANPNNSKFKSSKSYSKHLLSKFGLRDLLHYEDRNSMANSMESRLPYLDYRIVERGIKSSDYFKFRLGKLKGVLYDAYNEKLPSLIFRRIKKLAFDTPEKRLLDEGVFSIEDELNKLKNKFPDLPWNEKLNIQKINLFNAWQLYFLNIFLEEN